MIEYFGFISLRLQLGSVITERWRRLKRFEMSGFRIGSDSQ